MDKVARTLLPPVVNIISFSGSNNAHSFTGCIGRSSECYKLIQKNSAGEPLLDERDEFFGLGSRQSVHGHHQIGVLIGVQIWKPGSAGVFIPFLAANCFSNQCVASILGARYLEYLTFDPERQYFAALTASLTLDTHHWDKLSLARRC